MSRDVLLVHATWVRPEAWFWECARPGCGCAFGPLTTRDAATVQADEHIAEHHDTEPDGAS